MNIMHIIYRNVVSKANFCLDSISVIVFIKMCIKVHSLVVTKYILFHVVYNT